MNWVVQQKNKFGREVTFKQRMSEKAHQRRFLGSMRGFGRQFRANYIQNDQSVESLVEEKMIKSAAL